MAEEKAPLIWAVDLSKLKEGDLELFESGYLADVEVKCGDHTWKLHKTILCTRSVWFKKALTGAFKESETGVVTLQEQEQCDIGCFLKFIYTGCIDLLASYSGDDEFVALMRIWKTANFFGHEAACNLAVRAATDCAKKHTQVFCTADPGTDHNKDMEGIMESSFNPAVSLLYGEEMGHLKPTFLPIYMVMAIASVHRLSENEAFHALLADFPQFATDWATELVKVFRKWDSGRAKRSCDCCSYCGDEIDGKGTVDSWCWVRCGDLRVMCDDCYRMPALAEWRSTRK